MKYLSIEEMLGCQNSPWGILAEFRAEVEQLSFGEFEKFYKARQRELVFTTTEAAEFLKSVKINQRKLKDYRYQDSPLDWCAFDGGYVFKIDSVKKLKKEKEDELRLQSLQDSADKGTKTRRTRASKG